MTKNKLTNPKFYIPLAALCCLLWSSAFPMIKLGYRQFAIASDDYAAQILFAGCRFFLAGVLTLLFGSLLSRRLLLPKKGKTLLHIAILSLAQTAVHYTLFYLALAQIDGSAGSIINSAGTFFGVLLSAAVFQSDRLTGKKLFGCLLGLGGIVLLNLHKLKLGFHFSGEGLMLLAALCGAISAVLIKRFTQSDHPALLSGWQFMLGGLLMIGAGLGFGGRLESIDAKGIGIVLYLAFVSAAAYTLWGVLLKYNEVSRITVFGFINPVGGVFLSALLLGEQVNLPIAMASLALVSIGIVLVNVKTNSRLAH